MKNKVKYDWKIIGEKLKRIRESKNFSREDVASAAGTTATTIYRIENGTQPTAENLAKIAKALGISIDELLGVRNLNDLDEKEKIKIEDINTKLKRVPVLGEISAGKGIDALENLIDVIYIPEKKSVDFALLIRGDSMTPKFNPGDLALVVKTDHLENGEIGIVGIDGEQAVIKKYYNYGDKIQLISLNPEYEPIIITGEKLKDVYIFGKVVGKISWE
jgi:repressor LexA